MQKKILCFVMLTFFMFGCQEETPQPPAAELATITDAAETLQPKPEPPTPPILEDFQGVPKLSLFPRVGDYKPDDEEKLPYWITFIEHLSKVSGLVENKDDGNRAWGFRSINTIDSLGYFTPLAVLPDTSYRVTCKLHGELPDKASTGIGVLEFNEFLWVGEQYGEELFQKHYRGTQEGIRRAGSIEWEEQTFTFTTGPDTRMIHLVLFRDGDHDRKPILFDDIGIEVVQSNESPALPTTTEQSK